MASASRTVVERTSGSKTDQRPTRLRLGGPEDRGNRKKLPPQVVVVYYSRYPATYKERTAEGGATMKPYEHDEYYEDEYEDSEKEYEALTYYWEDHYRDPSAKANDPHQWDDDPEDEW